MASCWWILGIKMMDWGILGACITWPGCGTVTAGSVSGRQEKLCPPGGQGSGRQGEKRTWPHPDSPKPGRAPAAPGQATGLQDLQPKGAGSWTRTQHARTILVPAACWDFSAPQIPRASIPKIFPLKHPCTNAIGSFSDLIRSSYCPNCLK